MFTKPAASSDAKKEPVSVSVQALKDTAEKTHHFFSDEEKVWLDRKAQKGAIAPEILPYFNNTSTIISEIEKIAKKDDLAYEDYTNLAQLAAVLMDIMDRTEIKKYNDALVTLFESISKFIMDIRSHFKLSNTEMMSKEKFPIKMTCDKNVSEAKDAKSSESTAKEPVTSTRLGIR